MALKVKAGVQFTPGWAGFVILEAAKNASKVMGRDITITSGSDGTHSGPQDPHKLGAAYDFRSKDMTSAEKEQFLKLMWDYLGTKFYVFLEAKGTANEHFHAQRLKNTAYTVTDYLSRPL